MNSSYPNFWVTSHWCVAAGSINLIHTSLHHFVVTPNCGRVTPIDFLFEKYKDQNTNVSKQLIGSGKFRLFIQIAGKRYRVNDHWRQWNEFNIVCIGGWMFAGVALTIETLWKYLFAFDLYVDLKRLEISIKVRNWCNQRSYLFHFLNGEEAVSCLFKYDDQDKNTSIHNLIVATHTNWKPNACMHAHSQINS